MICSLKNDDFSHRIEISVVEFGSEAVISQNFVSLSRFTFKECEAHGESNLSYGLEKVFSQLKERYLLYAKKGVPAYSPYLFIFTRGAFNDDYMDGYMNAISKLNAVTTIIPEQEAMKVYLIRVESRRTKLLIDFNNRYLELEDEKVNFNGMVNWYIDDVAVPYEMRFTTRIKNDNYCDDISIEALSKLNMSGIAIFD